MLLSTKQVKEFWRLWSQACDVNGWNRDNGMSAADVDAWRKTVLHECGFDSLTRVDRTGGYTKVKNKLLILIGTDLKAAGEDQDTTANTARTHRWVIEKEILPCLTLYVENVEAYVSSIIADQMRYYKVDRPTRPPALDDLNPAQMAGALKTLSARLNTKRKASGNTIHDMKLRAGLECNCRPCCNRRMSISSRTIEAAKMDMAENPNWTV